MNWRKTASSIETYSQNYPNQEKLQNIYRLKSSGRSIAQRGRIDSPYVANRIRSRSNSYSGTVRVEAGPHKFNSLYDTLQ